MLGVEGQATIAVILPARMRVGVLYSVPGMSSWMKRGLKGVGFKFWICASASWSVGGRGRGLNPLLEASGRIGVIRKFFFNGPARGLEG